jgi:hypothetical protein
MPNPFPRPLPRQPTPSGRPLPDRSRTARPPRRPRMPPRTPRLRPHPQVRMLAARGRHHPRATGTDASPRPGATRRVRSSTMSDTHRCPVGDCPAQAPDERLICPRQWRLCRHPSPTSSTRYTTSDDLTQRAAGAGSRPTTTRSVPASRRHARADSRPPTRTLARPRRAADACRHPYQPPSARAEAPHRPSATARAARAAWRRPSRPARPRPVQPDERTGDPDAVTRPRRGPRRLALEQDLAALSEYLTATSSHRQSTTTRRTTNA